MDTEKIKDLLYKPAPDHSRVELMAAKCMKAAFIEISKDVTTKISKIDRLTSGVQLLDKCLQVIQCCQRANLCKDHKRRESYLEEAYFNVCDISTILGIYVESRIITVERYGVLGELVGKVASTLHKEIKSCNQISWK